MSGRRKALINQAFDIIDQDHDGIITVADMECSYNAKKHPKYINGEWTEDQVFGNFLKEFDSQDHPDGKVQKHFF